MTVAGVLCLVDREQGGRLNIERALAEVPGDREIPFHSVYTASDVRKAHIAVVKECVKLSPDSHTNSHRFLLRDDVWEKPGVEDITEELKAVDLG
jgi:orotate phosphoribosyltransferase